MAAHMFLENLQNSSATSEEKVQSAITEIARLQALNESIRLQAVAQDATYRERAAIQNLPAAQAVQALEASFGRRLASQRSAAEESDMLLAVHLHGKGADYAASNKLALSNMAEWKRIRQIAVNLALVAA